MDEALNCIHFFFIWIFRVLSRKLLNDNTQYICNRLPYIVVCCTTLIYYTTHKVYLFIFVNLLLICDSIAKAKLKFSGWKRVSLTIVVNSVYLYVYLPIILCKLKLESLIQWWQHIVARVHWQLSIFLANLLFVIYFIWIEMWTQQWNSPLPLSHDMIQSSWMNDIE